MGNVSISDVLSAPNLCGLVSLTKQGIPDVMPPAFNKVRKQVHRDYAEWKTQVGARGLATLTDYGAAAKDVQETNLGVQTAKCFHVFNKVRLPIQDFMNLLQYDNLEAQKMGAQEVARQAKFQTQKIMNTRVAANAAALFQGQINYDKQGNFLPSSSGAAGTMNFNVPSGNQNQLNVLGTGNIISTSWGSDAYFNADIPAQIRNLQVASLKLTGYPIKYAFYGLNVMTYLYENNILEPFLSRAAFPVPAYPNAVNQTILDSGQLPHNFLGLTWVPAYNFYYLDQNGAAQSFIGADEVVFTCDPDEADFWQPIEGSFPVPQKYDFTAPGDVLSNYSEQFGMFSYGKPAQDSPTADLYFGDTYLPAVTNGSCIFQATVNF